MPAADRVLVEQGDRVLVPGEDLLGAERAIPDAIHWRPLKQDARGEIRKYQG
jgi:hypothetical protein